MNKHIVAEICLAAAILACFIFIGINKLQQHDDVLRAQTAIDTRKQASQENQKALDDLNAKHAADSAAKDEEIATARKSRDAMAAFVNKAVPQAPGKVLVVGANPSTVTLHQGDAVIPYQSSEAYFDSFAAGNKCVTTELPDCQKKEALWENKFKLRDKDATDWETVANGGTFWHKAWGCTKIGGFGAAAGALPNDPNQRPRNSLIGFGLVFAPCMVIKHR